MQTRKLWDHVVGRGVRRWSERHRTERRRAQPAGVDEIYTPLHDRVRSGDLLVVNRDSHFQSYFDRSADHATHVAVVVWRDGQWVTIEIGPDGLFSRRLGHFASGYLEVAHLRNRMHPECIEAVVATAVAALDAQRHRFSLGKATALQLHQLGRRRVERTDERWIVRSAALTARLLEASMTDLRTTCSGFVYDCVGAACEECRGELAWPARPMTPAGMPTPGFLEMSALGATPSEAATATSTAGLPQFDSPRIVRNLITPSDLWVAPCFARGDVFRWSDSELREVATSEPTPIAA